MSSLVRIATAVGLVVALAVAAPAPASAQINADYGFTLGLNVPTLHSATGTADLSSRGRFSGGAIARFSTDALPWLALQPELLLSQRGVNVTGDEGTRIRYGASYAELPLQLRATLPSISVVTPHLLVGGFGAVKLFEQQSAGDEFNIPVDVDASFFNRTDAGFLGGIGGIVNVSEGSTLGLTVRYQYGMVDVAQSNDPEPIPSAPFPPDGKSSTWTVRLVFGL